MGEVAHLKILYVFLGKCEVISIPICKNVPYNMTVFPNYFQHKTQNEAGLEVHQFFPLVQVNCSADLAFFLCSLYAPLCSSLDVPPLPCRELCLRVRRGCLPLLQQYGYQWPDRMLCDKFPWRGGQDVCIDRPNAVDVTTPPPLPTKGKMKFDQTKLKSFSGTFLQLAIPEAKGKKMMRIVNYTGGRYSFCERFFKQKLS